MIPAYSPRRAGAVSATSAPGSGGCRRNCGCAGLARGKRPTVSWENYVAEFNRKFAVAAAARERVFAARRAGSGADFRAAARARGQPRQHRAVRQSRAADRAGALARNAGGLPGDGLRAPRGDRECVVRAAVRGAICACGRRGKSCGKAAARKTKSKLALSLANQCPLFTNNRRCTQHLHLLRAREQLAFWVSSYVEPASRQCAPTAIYHSGRDENLCEWRR